MQMDFGGNNLNGMMQAYADDYWSESNRNIYATFPRLSTTDIANNKKQYMVVTRRFLLAFKISRNRIYIT